MINTPQYPVKQSSPIHPGLQFLIFIGVFIGILILGNLAGAAIITALYGLKTLMALSTINTTDPHFISALWILQTTGTTLPIFITPVFFAYVIVHDPKDYIKPTFSIPWVLFLMVFVIMIFSNPLIEVLSNINQKMVLPPFFKMDARQRRQCPKDNRRIA